MTLENEFRKREHDDAWPGSTDLPDTSAVELEDVEWTQVDTPGSAVELEKVRVAAVEDTVQIPGTPLSAPEVIGSSADNYPIEVTPAEPGGADPSDDDYQPKRIYREPEPVAEPRTSGPAAEPAQAAAHAVEVAEPVVEVAEPVVEAVTAPMTTVNAAAVAETVVLTDANPVPPAAEELSAQQIEQEPAQVAAATMDAEAERVAAEREARNRALGVVAPTGVEIVAPPPPPKLVTDRFIGAFGLFLSRFMLAVVLGVHGYQMITDIGGLTAVLSQTRIPQPETMAWVAAISTLVLALAFLLGIMVRVAGFGLLTMMGLALAFIKWGPFQIFQTSGFLGELEFVLAGVGLIFLCLGGGRWGIDGSFRAARARAKENREG